MPNFDALLRNILSDLRVELTDEFDRNFERKAFFTEAWPNVRKEPGRGSLMQRTGALRQSVQSELGNQEITFKSSLPYASLHNEGGELTVTLKMKKFFWAKYIEAAGIQKADSGKTDWNTHTRIKQNKNGTVRLTAANRAAGQEILFWKAMALMKVGSKIKIPRRQFIGQHAEVDRMVREVVDANMGEVGEQVAAYLRGRGL